uniref:Uncharacterized protein n=1 Tax=Arundo donax TaxID=35708 RepID=A0A0A8YZI5_ARUDO
MPSQSSRSSSIPTPLVSTVSFSIASWSLWGLLGQSLVLSPTGKAQASRRQSRQYFSPPVT